MSQVTARGNTVASSATPGARVGVGSGSTWSQGSRAVIGGGPIKDVGIDSNQMSRVAAPPIQILSAGSGVAECSSNTLDGAPIATPGCAAAAQSPAAAGASLTCPAP